MKIVQTLKALGVTALVAAALLTSSSGALASGDAVQLGTAWTDLEVPALGAALPDLGDEFETGAEPLSSGDDGVSWEESAPAEPQMLEAYVEPVAGLGDGVSWED